MKKLEAVLIFGIIVLCIGIKFNSAAMNSEKFDKLDKNLQDLAYYAMHHLYLNNESVDNQKPFPEILVQKLAEYKSKHHHHILNTEELAALLQYFKEQESILKDHIKDHLISPYGGINYAMSLEEMKEATEETFKDMKQKGLIISESKFEKIKDLYYTAHHHTDLTRIWGAEYLKNKISASKELNGKYDIPDYIIVANDPNKIKVQLWFDHRFPVVGIIEDATIYFKNIKGDPIGCDAEVKKDIGKGSTLNYVDLCVGELTAFNRKQNENVIKDLITGKRYIVDTEFSTIAIGLPLELNHALRYGSKKFEYYNHIDFGNPDYNRIGDTIEYEFKLK